MSDPKKEPEYVSVQNMVEEGDQNKVEVTGSIFSILDEVRSGELSKLKFKKRRYSTRFKRAAIDGPKTTKYTIKLFDSEYEVLKTQVHQLNITIQYLIDLLLLDGFVKRDRRIIDFLNEKIKEELLSDKYKFNKIDQFSTLEIDELVANIESEELEDI